jgi:hypothetical protein
MKHPEASAAHQGRFSTGNTVASPPFRTPGSQDVEVEVRLEPVQQRDIRFTFATRHELK